ncbi:MAG: amidinotransferase [Candidatus Aminicenantes bacterium]|nr:MAG: amidinotransferase [Candidatus Aminicenantes bacterium]
MEYGCRSMVGKIRSILLKHPREAFLNEENIHTQWKELNYVGAPDFKRALVEYEEFIDYLKKGIPEVHFLPRNDKTGLDSIYVHDPVLVTEKGAILCKMGKEQRREEPEAIGDFLRGLDTPILGTINGEGMLEGGDVVLLNEHTMAVGLGYRTNQDGIRQLRNLTSGFIDELYVVPLPHWEGPEDVMHLMSLISPVDYNLAVVYSRLLPVPFRDWLLEREIDLVEVPDTEFGTMAANILALSPRRCLMLSGNPLTKEMLEKEGIEVFEYRGEEISLKGQGGPTCLTRPIFRD